MPQPDCPPLILLMGVSGSGKTVVGRGLATRLSLPFLDADDLHSPASVEKMRSGTPLTDADRIPWLDAVASRLAATAATGRGMVVACSALKRAYRDRLRTAGAPFQLVQLTAQEHVIQGRLAARTGHFMPAALLASQLATLEPPRADERAIVVDVSPSVDAVVAEIMAALTASP